MTAERAAADPPRHRALELDDRFGDPWDAGNPLGHAAVLAADERAELLAAGEAMLDDFGLGAEYVPAALGGRLSRLDHLIEIMRTVFRRDPCLGLGHGASTLIAAVNVWTGGRDAQRRAVADLLLANGKLACGYFELAHGNDLTRIELTARPDGDLLRIDGGKQVISNIERADAVVLFARTGAGPGSRSHSQLLIEKPLLAGAAYLPRFATAGMRGVQLGGIELRDCAIPADRVLGTAGRGLEIALTSFQVTRVALPGMFLGILDSGLRTTVRYALGRVLYGRSVADLPLTRTVLTDAFVDLLVCDCVTTSVARALHLLPREASVATAAAKCLVPRLLIDAMNRLASVLGASFYLRRGAHALFQKLLRDLPPSSFGHLARVAAQMTLLPQLPLLARRSWLAAEPAPAGVFTLDGPLPPLSFESLSLTAGGHDRLTASLVAVHDALAGGGPGAAGELGHRDRQTLRLLTAGFVAELGALKSACGALAPGELTASASADSYELTARYAVVLAAACCAGVWWHNQERDPFLRDPAWLVAALGRLAARLGAPPAPPSDDLATRLFAELMARHDAGRGFDLTNRPLPGWQRSAPAGSGTVER
jgi:alkylation response protein AidB-like acyl-CoA dehydrogenase